MASSERRKARRDLCPCVPGGADVVLGMAAVCIESAEDESEGESAQLVASSFSPISRPRIRSAGCPDVLLIRFSLTQGFGVRTPSHFLVDLGHHVIRDAHIDDEEQALRVSDRESLTKYISSLGRSGRGSHTGHERIENLLRLAQFWKRVYPT